MLIFGRLPICKSHSPQAQSAQSDEYAFILWVKWALKTGLLSFRSELKQYLEYGSFALPGLWPWGLAVPAAWAHYRCLAPSSTASLSSWIRCPISGSLFHQRQNGHFLYARGMAAGGVTLMRRGNQSLPLKLRALQCRLENNSVSLSKAFSGLTSMFCAWPHIPSPSSWDYVI